MQWHGHTRPLLHAVTTCAKAEQRLPSESSGSSSGSRVKAGRQAGGAGRWCRQDFEAGQSRGAGGGRARQLILHQAMSRSAGGGRARQLVLHLGRQLILHTAGGRQAGRQRQAEAGRQAEVGRQPGRQTEAGRQVAASSIVAALGQWSKVSLVSRELWPIFHTRWPHRGDLLGLAIVRHQRSSRNLCLFASPNPHILMILIKSVQNNNDSSWVGPKVIN